jgi:superfamily II DNA or RNA helicase
MVGAYLIEQRGVNALVLVHRRHVMDQWRERLATFLELPVGNLGQFWGGKNNRTGLVDVAIIQSLQQRLVHDFVAEYGHVIINECHRLCLDRNQSNSWQ